MPDPIETLKQKYPVYAHIENHELARLIVKKYPVYKQALSHWLVQGQQIDHAKQVAQQNKQMLQNNLSAARQGLGIDPSVNLHQPHPGQTGSPGVPVPQAHSQASAANQVAAAREIAQAQVLKQKSEAQTLQDPKWKAAQDYYNHHGHYPEPGITPGFPWSSRVPSPQDAPMHKIASEFLRGKEDEKGSFWNQVQPGFDDVIRNTQGIHGSLRRGAAGLIDPQNIALMAAMALAGPELAPLLGHVFTADMARGLVQSAMDTDKMKSDPHGYWGDILFQGTMMGLPHAAPHLWAKIKEGSESNIGQKQTYAIINELKAQHEELFARAQGAKGFHVTDKGRLKEDKPFVMPARKREVKEPFDPTGKQQAKGQKSEFPPRDPRPTGLEALQHRQGKTAVPLHLPLEEVKPKQRQPGSHIELDAPNRLKILDFREGHAEEASGTRKAKAEEINTFSSPSKDNVRLGEEAGYNTSPEVRMVQAGLPISSFSDEQLNNLHRIAYQNMRMRIDSLVEDVPGHSTEWGKLTQEVEHEREARKAKAEVATPSPNASNPKAKAEVATPSPNASNPKANPLTHSEQITLAEHARDSAKKRVDEAKNPRDLERAKKTLGNAQFKLDMLKDVHTGGQGSFLHNDSADIRPIGENHVTPTERSKPGSVPRERETNAGGRVPARPGGSSGTQGAAEGAAKPVQSNKVQSAKPQAQIGGGARISDRHIDDNATYVNVEIEGHEYEIQKIRGNRTQTDAQILSEARQQHVEHMRPRLWIESLTKEQRTAALAEFKKRNPNSRVSGADMEKSALIDLYNDEVKAAKRGELVNSRGELVPEDRKPARNVTPPEKSLTGETSKPTHVNRTVFRQSIDKLKAAGHDVEHLEGGFQLYTEAKTPSEIKAASLALRDELQKTDAKKPVKAPERPAQAAKPAAGKNVPTQGDKPAAGIVGPKPQTPRSKTRGAINFGYAEGSPADKFYKSVREAARRISQQGDDWTTFAKLYAHMKQNDPTLTREAFANSIKDLEKVPGVHLEGPTGPTPKREDVFGGHFAVWFDGNHEDIAPSYKGMSPVLKDLHDHPVRKAGAGFGVSSYAAVDNYIGRLEAYAKSKHPDVMSLIDDAWGYIGKGQYGKATDAAEQALSKMHQAESARPKAIGSRSRTSGKLDLGPGRPGSLQARATSAVQSLINRVKDYAPSSKLGGRYHMTAVIDPETADLIHTRSNIDSYGEQLGSQAFRRVTAGLTPDEVENFVKFMQSNNLEVDNPSHPYVLPKSQMKDIWGKSSGKKLTTSQARIQAAALEHNAIQNELFSMVKKGKPGIKKKVGLRHTGPGGEDLFMNMIPKKDAAGNPLMINSKPGATSRSLRKQMTVNPSRATLRREGTGVEYETDLEKIYQAAYKNALPGAIMHDIYSGMVKKGIGMLVKPNQKIPSTITYNGVVYPASHDVYRSITLPNGLKREEYIAFPAQIHADIKDATSSKAFGRRTYVDPNAPGGPKEKSSTPARDAEHALTDIQLASPKVITGHSLRVITMVTKMIDPSLPGVRRAIDTLFNVPTIGTVPRLTRLYDLADLNPASTSEYISKEGHSYSNQSIRVDLARVNAVDNRTFDNTSAIANTPGIKQLREMGHGLLFSEPKGPSELFKAKTPSQLYKAISEFGLDIRAKIMIEKVRRMVDGYDPKDPQLDDKMRKEGYKLGEYVKKPSKFVEILKFMNTYAGTSAPMRATELKQFFGITGRTGKALTPAQRAAWRTQTIAMSGIGTFMGYVAWNKLLSGHMPWDNKSDNTLEYGNGWHISMSDVDPADTRAITTLGLMRSAKDLQTGDFMDIPKSTAKGVIGAATDLAVGPGLRILGTAAGRSFYVMDPHGNAVLAKPYPGAQSPLPGALYDDDDSGKDTYVKRFRAVLGEIVPVADPLLDLFGGSTNRLSALRSPKAPPLDDSEVNPWDSLWRHVQSADALFNSGLIQPDKQPKSSGAVDPKTQKYMRQFESFRKEPSYK